jgi:acyl carrier protein
MEDAAREVEQVVRDALVRIRPAAAGLGLDADLAGEAGLDSVEVMDMVMAIEDKLDLSIPVETLSEAHTIRGLCTGILGLMRSRTS